MTRIPYRRPEDMTEQARELTAERGNLNVYRTLANAENAFTGWMLAGRDALTSPVLSRRLQGQSSSREVRRSSRREQRFWKAHGCANAA